MALKKYKPVTPGRRFLTVSDYSELSGVRPLKSLLKKISETGGRNNQGRETNINIGGGHKRRFRTIDFKRDKVGVPGKVATIEYDPNRTARIALIHFADGDKRYILAPEGLKVGQAIMTGATADIKPGNCLPLRNIPTGEAIHNIEVKRGAGGKLVRSAGVLAQLIAKEGDYALIRMPSAEMRKVHLDCFACVGQVGNSEHMNISLGKAGRSRWLGIRPHTRGVSKNPVDHPMGGGQGKTAGGRHPCPPTGVLSKGLKTRANKRTDKFILKHGATIV